MPGRIVDSFAGGGPRPHQEHVGGINLDHNLLPDPVAKSIACLIERIDMLERNLADLRLWQSGSWLVDAAPTMSVIEPQSGRPLALCQLTADLAPGLYRLTAYGGPEVRCARR